jgi:hypothetical protein
MSSVDLVKKVEGVYRAVLERAVGVAAPQVQVPQVGHAPLDVLEEEVDLVLGVQRAVLSLYQSAREWCSMNSIGLR